MIQLKQVSVNLVTQIDLFMVVLSNWNNIISHFIVHLSVAAMQLGLQLLLLFYHTVSASVKPECSIRN